MLLLGSFAAMLLSAGLLVIPANADITSHCTDCTKDEGTFVIVSACKPTGVDGCFCPLSNPTTNNCFFIGAEKPQK
ncbi:MAG TPA: hypothetical protein VKY85_06250 [Candidatus Angelobacter sp.]|nr:hypothetical protein [Candidatus Angelobacter sp.]